MKKSILLGIAAVALCLGIWLLVHSNVSVPATATLPKESIPASVAAKVNQPVSVQVKKLEAVAVVRPATSQVIANSSAGLISVPASQHVNADGLLLAEDLASSDGTVRIQKRYDYNADKILTRELEIRVSDGVMTTVDYLIASDGKVQVRVTDEKGNVTIE